LTEKLHYKENEPVHAKIVEPVYVFDRVVIPAGTEVLGQITRLRKGGAGKRLLSMLGGDFSPQSEPAISFDTLILPDGSRISIDTSVFRSTESVTIKSSGSDFQPTTEKSSKGAKDILWALSPYRAQVLPAGTRLKAVLDEALPMGNAIVGKAALKSIGSRPPEGSVVSARLITPLESRTSKPGDSVNALVTRPLFSEDHRLIVPAGSLLHGEVLAVRAAKSLHRNGSIDFHFTSIETPVLETGLLEERQLAGTIAGIHVGADMADLRISAEGDAHIAESKMRFLSPAYAALKAGYSLNATAAPLGRALPDAYMDSFLKSIVGSRGGFGLVGGVSAAMIPPLGIGFAFYGAAGSIYSTFIGKGHDIRLPADTSIEIQLTDTGRTQ
jgi:hypothetical protein